MTNHSRSITELVAKIKAIPRDQYEYLEVKQLAEILARHRAKTRAAIDEYRTLKNSMGAETDPVEKLYMGYESMFLRDHLRDAWRLYRLVCNDFYMAYNSYLNAIANTPVLPASFNLKLDTLNTDLSQIRRNVA